MTHPISRILTVMRLCAVAAPLLAQEDIVRVEQWRVQEGDDPRWAAPAFDDSGWRPSSWPRRQSVGQAFYAGTRWYRATASIPPNLAGQPLALAMTPLDEVFDVFVNGVRIGTFGNWEPTPAGRFLRFASFPIPPRTLDGPRVHLAIRRWTGGGRTDFSFSLRQEFARILRNEKSTSPAEILSALNEGLTGHTGGGFVTCCCARFDLDGTVTLASAGHPAPYADGRELAVETGLPLGLAPGVTYDESTSTGHHFTFVSDGVIEAENAQRELFGFDRTRDISGKSAQEIAHAAQAWGQNDDITVVTVRRNA